MGSQAIDSRHLVVLVSGLPTGPCALHVHRRLGIPGRHRPQALQELTGRIECWDDCSFRTWRRPWLLVSFLGRVVSRTDNVYRSDAISGSLDVHYGLSHAGSDHPFQGTPRDAHGDGGDWSRCDRRCCRVVFAGHGFGKFRQRSVASHPKHWGGTGVCGVRDDDPTSNARTP